MEQGLDLDLFSLIVMAGEPSLELRVSAVIRNFDGYVIVKGDGGTMHGLWHLPGGPCDFDLTFHGSLRRAVAAQLGTDLTGISPLPCSVAKYALPRKGGPARHVVEIMFTAIALSALEPGDGISAWRRADDAALRRLHRSKKLLLAPSCIPAIESVRRWAFMPRPTFLQIQPARLRRRT